MVRKLQKMCSYFKNMGCEQENKDKRKMDREGKESWREDFFLSVLRILKWEVFNENINVEIYREGNC